ncbi:MAG: membrane integrity-associated transporter subunit PqiC [Gemmatimonas sp.]
MLARTRIGLMAAAFAAALAACAGQGTPSRYYVLSPTAPESDRRPDGPAVSVGPVTLAKYLDRPQIVTRPTPNQLDVAEFDRWGGRLEDNVAQTLAEDLGRRLGTARVTVFPAEPVGRTDARVSVTIGQFERIGDGSVVLEARWRLIPAGGEPTMDSSRIVRRASGSGYAATVAAMSDALGDLAERIAAAMSGRVSAR